MRKKWVSKLRKGNLFVIYIGLQTTATTTTTAKFITLTIPPSILGSLQCRHHFNHHIYYFSSIDTRGGSRGRVQGVCILPPPPRDDLRFSNTTCILQKKTMWFIDVEVEQETCAPPPKKNPGSNQSDCLNHQDHWVCIYIEIGFNRWFSVHYRIIITFTKI